MPGLRGSDLAGNLPLFFTVHRPRISIGLWKNLDKSFLTRLHIGFRQDLHDLTCGNLCTTCTFTSPLQVHNTQDYMLHIGFTRRRREHIDCIHCVISDSPCWLQSGWRNTPILMMRLELR